MNTKESDFSTAVLKRARRIASGIEQLAKMLKADKAPRVFANELPLTMLTDARQLLALFAPLKSSGKTHGVTIQFADLVQVLDISFFPDNHSAKDFGSWAMKLAGRIHRALQAIAQALTEETSDATSPLIDQDIAEIRFCSASIIQLVENELTLREVRCGEDGAASL